MSKNAQQNRQTKPPVEEQQEGTGSEVKDQEQLESGESQLIQDGERKEPVTPVAEDTAKPPVEDKLPEVPVVKEPVVPVAAVSTPTVQPSTLKTTLDLTDILAQMDVSSVGYIQAVKDYMVAMAKGRSVTDAEIHRYQVNFLRNVVSMINNVENDFDKVMNVFLYLFNENPTGAFDEVRIYRHLPHLNLGGEEFKAFQFLTDLFRLTADPKTRTIALKQVDLTKSLAYGLTERGRQKMISFYGK